MSKKQELKRAYSWRPGFSYKADPEQVGLEIERLIEENGQKLEASTVVSAAENPTSPMHNLFEWDDTKAAEEHRLQQARTLLRSIHVTITTPKGQDIVTNLVVSTEKDGPRRRQYSTTEYALNDPELRAEVLGQALRELASFRRKYAELSELVHVFRAIDKVAKAG